MGLRTEYEAAASLPLCTKKRNSFVFEVYVLEKNFASLRFIFSYLFSSGSLNEKKRVFLEEKGQFSNSLMP